MSNLIKVMDLANEVVSTLDYNNEKEFMFAIATAVHNQDTSVIMYQKDLPKAMKKVLTNSVDAHNGFAGTTIRVEESKLLPEYVKSSGFGTVDTLSTEYWTLRDVDLEEKDINELHSAYKLVEEAIADLIKASGLTKSKAVFYLRTKNQKKAS
jgi:hypothetical protein